MSLSPTQIGLLQNSLVEIVRMENGEKDPDEERKKQEQITSLQVEALQKSGKLKSGKLGLSDLYRIGGGK